MSDDTHDPPADGAGDDLTPADTIFQHAHDAEREIGVDLTASGHYTYVTAPKGWRRDTRISLFSQNLEHVADDAHGVWLYRAM